MELIEEAKNLTLRLKEKWLKLKGEQLTQPETVDEFLAREDAPIEESIAYLLGYQRGVEYAYEKLRMIVYTDEGKILEGGLDGTG
jgi:hypothetical protein